MHIIFKKKKESDLIAIVSSEYFFDNYGLNLKLKWLLLGEFYARTPIFRKHNQFGLRLFSDEISKAKFSDAERYRPALLKRINEPW